MHITIQCKYINIAAIKIITFFTLSFTQFYLFNIALHANIKLLKASANNNRATSILRSDKLQYTKL